jgi:beta-galactosidase
MQVKLMKILFINVLLGFVCPLMAQDYFPKEKLMTIGVYYYPEHWSSEQWERDIKNIAKHGFEFIHMAEFSWAQMEPKEGVFDFTWLDKVVALAKKNNLKVILGTPTPCPPVWLGIKHPDIYIMGPDYQRKEHGTRANISLSNPNLLKYSKKIVQELANHYADNEVVIGWQLDNEPEAKEDYSPSAQKAFRKWLISKYKTIQVLNDAWGTRFWSQLYASFDEIKIHNVTSVGWWGTNPIALLDFKRFSADKQAEFLDMQAAELRKHISNRQFITTNYVAKGNQTDPGRTKLLDFASYTAYPNYGSDNLGDLGFRLGKQNVLLYANDYFRSLNGITGVMELQPGQVNWGGYNPLLLPGTVRMWLWHCFGGGSSFACTYRYRQILYGAEQFHSGVVETDGVSLSPGGKEYAQVIKEMNSLRKSKFTNRKMPEKLKKRKAAILWSYDNLWNLQKQKQTNNWDTWGHMHKYHRILKSLGAPVDFVSEEADFSKYNFLVVPAYQMVDSTLVNKWKEYVENGGNLIISCRTGAKDKNAHLWESNYAGIMNELIGGEIERFDMLPASKNGKVELNGKMYTWNIWGEQIKPYSSTQVLAKYSDQFYKGKACCLMNTIGKGKVVYIGVDSKDGSLEKDLIRQLYDLNNVKTDNFPNGVLVYWRDGFMVAVNYSSENYLLNLPGKSKILIGNKSLAPAGVTVWFEE